MTPVTPDEGSPTDRWDNSVKFSWPKKQNFRREAQEKRDPDAVFGRETCDLGEIFGQRYKKPRKETGNWSRDGLTGEELSSGAKATPMSRKAQWCQLRPQHRLASASASASASTSVRTSLVITRPPRPPPAPASAAPANLSTEFTHSSRQSAHSQRSPQRELRHAIKQGRLPCKGRITTQGPGAKGSRAAAATRGNVNAFVRDRNSSAVAEAETGTGTGHSAKDRCMQSCRAMRAAAGKTKDTLSHNP